MAFIFRSNAQKADAATQAELQCGTLKNDTLPEKAKKLMSAYPDFVKEFKNNHIVCRDGTKLIFDDGKEKSFTELTDMPYIQDMFAFIYPKGKIEKKIEKNRDPGRIRNDSFFGKMYGETNAEVQKNLDTVVWCPVLVGQKLQVTSVNDVDKHLMEISAELDRHPEWKQYLRSAGAFNWRVINGTKRMSVHSFGIAIDLDTKYSNYWQWDCGCKNENINVAYRNQIPHRIVDVFENNGFIWGGRWYHYDTMHFEYRPELLINKK
jgi:hypothetical protein